jgi:hypothetical protein
MHCFLILCLSTRDGVDTDDRVGVTSEQGLTISRPGQGDGLGRGRFLADVSEFGLELINNRLALQVPNLDAGGSGSAQPVAVGGEDEGVDGVTSLQGVQVLAFVEVPEHGDTVLTTGSAEGTIGGDGDSGDETSVTVVVGLELALGDVPDLSNFNNNDEHM